MTRQSTIRILKNAGLKLKKNFNIIESEDGIDTIYLVYKSILSGIKISLIFSDENMMFINGSQSSKILNSVYEKIKGKHIPFYSVTAYDQSVFDFGVNFIKKVCSKPLDSFEVTQILMEFFETK